MGDRMTFISDAGYSVDDPDNSTSAPLGAGDTFVGATVLNSHPGIFIDVETDQDCTVFKEFSVDGVNFNAFPSSGYPLNSVNGHILVDTTVKAGRYHRVRIVNGPTPQGFLRARVYLGIYGQLSSPLSQAYGQQAGSRLVRPTWTWLDIARGLSTGITSIKKFGENAGVGTTFEVVALNGVYPMPQSSAATTLRIAAGGDPNDTAAGTGARGVTLYGLDENFNEVQETVATAGASASSATSTTFTRLYRIVVDGSGTYATTALGSHSGDIDIENGSGGTAWGHIDASSFPNAQSEIAAYTVPTGFSGFAKLRNVSIDSGKTIDLAFFSRANADEASAPYSPMRIQSVVAGITGGSIEVFGDTDVPFGPYVGPTDIGFMARASAGTASVSVEFEVILISD